MAVQERVRFQGDPEIMETGAGDGQEAQIPLDKTIRPTEVQMLGKNGKPLPPSDDDDGDDDDAAGGEGGPAYSRERVGAKIGGNLEDIQQMADVERALDASDVIPCLFPTAVNLQHEGLMHHFAPGVHLVPISIAGETPKGRHWWLKRNRVRHAGPRQASPALAGADEDDE